MHQKMATECEGFNCAITGMLGKMATEGEAFIGALKRMHEKMATESEIYNDTLTEKPEGWKRKAMALLVSYPESPERSQPPAKAFKCLPPPLLPCTSNKRQIKLLPDILT